MKDIILVNIVADHTWECATNIIGRTGEGGTAQFKITLTESEMCSFSAFLEFKKPNGKKFKSSQLDIVDNVITYDIPKYLLSESGKLQVQLILEKASGEIWESNPKTYYILESISGADEQLPEIDGGSSGSGSNGSSSCECITKEEIQEMINSALNNVLEGDY